MTTASAANLDRRYGRTPGRRRRAVVLAVVVGAAVLAAAIAWVIWVGLFAPGTAIDNQDVGYRHVDATTIAVTEQISTNPGTAVTCSFEAVDEKHAIVGWKVVDLPASTERTYRHTERIRVSQPAVNGSVGACWAGKD
ncbi:DUF4307 domain-containing protein [Pseudolysinimonas sp.]|uniref:DUF4307 domain-containing protein n=1 Tax=Pseudolysinimonas sp. TaxID=2680009 RepID=UPI003F7DC432